MKEVILDLISDVLKKEKIKLNKVTLEIPPTLEMGDYSFPCFSLSKEFKKSPNQIAEQIAFKLSKNKLPKELSKIKASGPYVNFFLNKEIFAKKIIQEVLNKKENFGKTNLGKNKNIIIEFSSPNIAKPFGIGHLRSTIIGNSIANICKSMRFKTIRINYLGDWGTQFGKLLFGYKKFGNKQKLKKDSIKHLLEIYIKINKNEKYEKESREFFKKLEQGDKELLKLWNEFRELSLKKFKEIYNFLGIKFDIYSGESLSVKKSDKIIQLLGKKGLLQESEGAKIVDLEKYNLGNVLIQKSDGATLYATREIAAAIERYNKYKFQKMIYEVGQEQSLHFNQIFKVLELMDYPWSKECIHIDHGLYLDKDGKKFSTRKGKTIFMQDILNETISLAKKEIKKREPKISEKELIKRAHKIAIGAIFYGDLKNNRRNNMVFDIKRFVSFEGDTGPYIQYSYARASSILRKSKNNKKIKISKLEQKEKELVQKISQFPQSILNAYQNMNPSVIANYSYQLSKIFNEFYHTCPVIGSEQESFRLALIKSFRQVLKNSLDLLGIKTLEKM